MTYKNTLYASYIAYMVQAITINFAPLVFYRFQTEFEVSLQKITLIVALNFSIQLLTDLAAGKIIKKTGYRFAAITSQFMCSLGLILLGTLPYTLKNPYIGILISTFIMAIGAGLLEVIVSPIIEALPLGQKTSRMNILHSFYCWGQMLSVLLSTLFFKFIGIQFWRYAALLWAIVPALNFILFLRAPLCTLPADEKGLPLFKMVTPGKLILLMMCMMSAGAAEISISQWVSFFAEAGLGISKELGDIIGICTFAAFMGISRILYSVFDKKINLEKLLLYSGIGSVVFYLLTVFSPWPILSLISCALIGASIGSMWPGIISLSVKTFPMAGATLFGIIAFSGDFGCTAGPGIVGLVSDKMITLGFTTEQALKTGILGATLFPVIFLISISLINLKQRKKVNKCLDM